MPSLSRRSLLPLTGLVLFWFVGGCSQAIADLVLVPPRFEKKEAFLAKERAKVEAKWESRLKTFTFDSFDGTPIAGFIFEPECPQKGTIVVLHGLSDRKESMMAVAEAFADSGYLTVVPDLRAHGESGGRYTTLSYREKQDQVALLNYLAGRGADVDHVGVLGGSLGAAIAIQWAAIDPRVKSVVAVAPFAELRTELDYLYRRHDIGEWKAELLEAAAQQQGHFRVEDVSPLRAMRSLQTPVYLAHGYQDKLIPVTESERLYAAARGPCVFQKTISGHLDIRKALGRDFMDRAVEWMDLYVANESRPVALPSWTDSYASRNLGEPAPFASRPAAAKAGTVSSSSAE